MRSHALHIRWRTGAASYGRVQLALTTGLAAAPLAPFIGPIAGAAPRPPAAIEARVATLFAAALVIAMFVRTITRKSRRSRRQTGIFLLSVVIASSAAAYVITARANSFFIADLLYEAMAALLALSVACEALRTDSERAPETGLAEDGRPFFSPYHSLSDALTRTAVWFVVAFWGLVIARLHYIAAAMLILLGGMLTTTLLLRFAERVVPSFHSPRDRPTHTGGS